MTQDLVIILSVLGVVGQVLVVIGIVAGLLALAGVRGPLDAIRNLLWGYELWGAFVVAAIATGGSLFYSQVALFIPCEFCWFQRILMYPLSILTLLIAARGDNRAARYLMEQRPWASPDWRDHVSRYWRDTIDACIRLHIWEPSDEPE